MKQEKANAIFITVLLTLWIIASLAFHVFLIPYPDGHKFPWEANSKNNCSVRGRG